MHDPQRDTSPGRRELSWRRVLPPGTSLLHPTPVVSLLCSQNHSKHYLFCMCLLPWGGAVSDYSRFHDMSDSSLRFSKVDVME